MKDTIIKGSRNSRSIIAASTLSESWADARAQLITQGWAIDLGPLNPAGVEQMGDPLNKETLLKDATAALYGKNASAVPDDIFAAIKTLITDTKNSAPKTAYGTYTGDGTAFQSIYFQFKPKFFLCAPNSPDTIFDGSKGVDFGIGVGEKIFEIGVFNRNTTSPLYDMEAGIFLTTGVRITGSGGNSRLNKAGASYSWFAVG